MTMTHEEKLAKKRAYRAAHSEERNLKRRERRKIFRMLHKDEYEAKMKEKNDREKQRRVERRIKFPKTYKVHRLGNSLHVVIPHKIAKELNIHAGDRMNVDANYSGIIVRKACNI